MDRKFVSFLILSAMILIGFNLLNAWMNPIDPNAVVQQPLDETQDTDNGDDAAEEPTSPNEPADEQQPAEITNEDEIGADLAGDMPPVAEQHITLGSLDPESPFKMLVWATNRGAAIEAIALNDPRYTELDDK